MVGRREAKRLISEAASGFSSVLNNLNKDQAKAVLKEAQQLSESNCSWQAYWLKEALIRFASDRLLDFKKPRKTKKVDSNQK